MKEEPSENSPSLPPAESAPSLPTEVPLAGPGEVDFFMGLGGYERELLPLSLAIRSATEVELFPEVPSNGGRP